MRFNSKKHRDGEERTIKRFAFLPTRIDDNTVIWFEWYWSKERYIEGWDSSYWRAWRKEMINDNPGK